jgi:hypothetical protein
MFSYWEMWGKSKIGDVSPEKRSDGDLSPSLTGVFLLKYVKKFDALSSSSSGLIRRK